MTPRQAYRAVRTAIGNGTLTRPKSCQSCGRSGKASDGRSIIHAHHHDYSKPLDVEWICAKCHRNVTPLPKTMGSPNYGEKNGSSKLTEKQVKEIRQLNLPSRKIAAIYGVDKSTINRVKNNEHWAAAPTPAKEG